MNIFKYENYLFGALFPFLLRVALHMTPELGHESKFLRTEGTSIPFLLLMSFGMDATFVGGGERSGATGNGAFERMNGARHGMSCKMMTLKSDAAFKSSFPAYSASPYLHPLLHTLIPV